MREERRASRPSKVLLWAGGALLALGGAIHLLGYCPVKAGEYDMRYGENRLTGSKPVTVRNRMVINGDTGYLTFEPEAQTVPGLAWTWAIGPGPVKECTLGNVRTHLQLRRHVRVSNPGNGAAPRQLIPRSVIAAAMVYWFDWGALGMGALVFAGGAAGVTAERRRAQVAGAPGVGWDGPRL